MPPTPSNSPRPEVWSFFSGAMGLDLGLARVGIETTLAVDIDKTCCETVRRNKPDLDFWCVDVSELSEPSLRRRRRFEGEVDLMVGGPPCQSFCPGGTRAALRDPRGNLIYSYLALVQEVRPRAFVLENVANLVTAAVRHRPIHLRPGKSWNLSRYDDPRASGRISGGGVAEAMRADELSGSALRQLAGDIHGMGYAINFGVLDAADYGAAQHRLRFVMLGSRDGPAPALPRATHGPASGQPFRTTSDAIADLANRPGPHSGYTPEVARHFAMVPPGGNWRDLPPDIKPLAMGEASLAAGGGKTGFFRRLAWDRPAPTITGRSNRKGSALCHPSATRPLSVTECARLQGFPDDWQFAGSMSQQYVQVGNAVPVPMAAAIGDVFRRDERVAQSLSFDAMLAAAIRRLRSAARNKRGRVARARQQILFSTSDPHE